MIIAVNNHIDAYSDLPKSIEQISFTVKDSINIHELYEAFDTVARALSYTDETIDAAYEYYVEKGGHKVFD